MTLVNPLTLEETARAIGRSESWFYRHWGELVAGDGFPPPIHCRAPYVWDAVHVYAWIDRQLPHTLAEPVQQLRGVGADPRESETITAWRGALHRTYGVSA